MNSARSWQSVFFGPLKYYYFSLLGAYLLVPLGFAYMTASFVRKTFNSAPFHMERETFFLNMMLVAFLSAITAITVFSLWMAYLLHRAGASRSRLDIAFAAAPAGVPVFCFVLGWLNWIH